jgi:hypothetical protein
MSEKTVLMEIIEKINADSKFLNGENDSPMDRAVGQYIKSIADDLQENYLHKEKQQLVSFGYAQIQYIDAEIGDCVYKKLPEEIYNETYGGQS